MRNNSLYGTNDLVDRFMAALRELGPRDSLNEVRLARKSDEALTLAWSIAGESFRLHLQVKVTPATTASITGPATAMESSLQVVLAPFISRTTQEEFEHIGLSYWDPTGNLLLQSQKPFLWIKQNGSTKNPNPDSRNTTLQTLKGRSASEVLVRLLSDGRAASLRDLARESGASLGTVSRVVTLLRNENLLEPNGGGPIVVRDPLRLAQRWAEDYSFEKTYKAKRYFSVLGSNLALGRIQESGVNYALTGLAAQSLWYEADARVAPLPASAMWLYTDDLDRVQQVGDLVPDGVNGTIMLAQADLFGVGREGYRVVGSARIAWPWRVVGDLISVPGRYASAGVDFAQELIKRPMSPYV